MRRLPGENLRDDCIRETTQGSGRFVMVMAGVNYICGNTPLVVPYENVNVIVYQEIWDDHCLPHARRVYGNNSRLQDENARQHRAAAVRKFLDAERMQQLPWHAYSPDMSPSEHGSRTPTPWTSTPQITTPSQIPLGQLPPRATTL